MGRGEKAKDAKDMLSKRLLGVRLPGRKIPRNAPDAIGHIAVDVTESPMQRPKKTKKSGIPAKRNVIRSKRRQSLSGKAGG
jgi:hypothetical protein